MTDSQERDQRQLAHALAWLRVCAILGQLLAIGLVVGVLRLGVPSAPLLGGIAALGVVCIAGFWRLVKPRGFTPIELVGWFALDIAELAYMLYFTGGASNPFITLLIMPIALAATALPMRHVFGVTVLASAAYGFLILRNVPLPLLHAHDPSVEFGAHLLGMAVTFVICGGVLAFFISRLARDARAQAAAVQRERERALRDEGILAIAVQAAGAAHELNTPLSTLATLVAELQREHAAQSGLSSDLHLLADQINRCRDILRGVVAMGTGQSLDVPRERTVAALVGDCIERFRMLRPDVELETEIAAADRETRVLASSDLDHSLLNLLDNAGDASQTAGSSVVQLSVKRAGANVLFAVRDFGPGPARADLGFGLRFFSSKRDGLGIGVALASATAERHRGSLRQEPADGGGARTILSLPQAGDVQTQTPHV